MTDRPGKFDGEKRQTDALAPENENSEQRDGDMQAQTVAQEAIARTSSVLRLEDSEKDHSGIDETDAQDLVDHMKQMDRGNVVDMSACKGEPDHDDETETYGSGKDDGEDEVDN